MHRKHMFPSLIGLAAIFLAELGMAAPVGTAFTYQGQLKFNGSPVNGDTTIEFTMWDAATAGNQVGPLVNPSPVNVSNGLFTVQLDFGVNAFSPNEARWIEMKVNGAPLIPRQPLTPTPFALNTRGVNVDPTGKVGLGTTSPVTNLQVAGTASTDMLQLGNGNNSSGNTQLVMGVTSDSNGASIVQSVASSGAPGGWGNMLLNPHGGNVGIGTSNPVAPLHVVGSNDFPHLKVEAASNAPYGAFLSLDAAATEGGKNWHIFSTGGMASEGQGSLIIQNATDAGLYAVAITSAGNVGIGTNGPSEKLSVDGVVESINGGFKFPDGSIQATAATGAGSWSSSGSDIYNSNGGYVGIGTANPSRELDVNGVIVTNKAFAFSSSTGPNVGGSGMNAPVDDSLGFFTGGVDRIRINGAGNVGIGTSSPVAKLQVDSNTHPAVVVNSSDGSGTWLTLNNTGGGSGWTFISSGGSNGEGANKLMFFDENDQNVRMVIDENGKVGIGNAFPSEQLSVDGMVESINGGFKFPDGSVQTTAAAGGSTPWQSSGNDISNTNSGNVGIGTDSPISILDVRGSGGILTNNAFGFSAPSSGPVASDTFINSPGGQRIAFTTASAERMRIDYNGNVGIGTATPGARLQVDSDTHPAVVVNSSDGSGTWLTLNNSGGGSGWTLISSGNNNGEGANKLMFFDENDQNVRMVIDGDGKVGIGNAFPSQQLSVAGNICATGTIGACSDARFKDHIEPVADALDMVEQLQGVTFDWKREEFCDHQFAEGRQLGFIAQQVRNVLPQVVSEGSDGYLSVDYGRLTPVIVEAVKQIKSEKDEQIASLQNKNAALNARLDRLESLINKASN